MNNLNLKALKYRKESSILGNMHRKHGQIYKTKTLQCHIFIALAADLDVEWVFGLLLHKNGQSVVLFQRIKSV